MRLASSQRGTANTQCFRHPWRVRQRNKRPLFQSEQIETKRTDIKSSGPSTATSLDTPTARQGFLWRACLLTVPSQATAKSLSSPFEHGLDAALIERTPLGEMPVSKLEPPLDACHNAY